MLQRLRLLNFQSHVKTDFEFSPNVNVITGTSDAGKSTAIRGLEWVFNNRPPGDAIKNWQSQERDKVGVSVIFSDESIITKERVKGKSSYIVGLKDSTNRFEAIKQDVPDVVSDLADLNECNVQTQHQPYFFLNDTAGEVARKLNELVGLDIIDTIFKNLDSRIRRVSSDVRTTTSNVANLKEEIDNLAYTDVLYDEVVELEKLINSAEELEKDADGLGTYIYDLNKIEENLGSIFCPIEAEEPVNALLAEIKKLGEDQKDCTTLRNINSSLDKIDDDLKAETEWLECEPLYIELVDLIKNQDEEANNCLDLTRSINKILLDDKAFEYEAKQVGKLFTEYVTKLRLAKICPICQSKITEATIKTIEENL